MSSKVQLLPLFYARAIISIFFEPPVLRRLCNQLIIGKFLVESV
jgi:hypothetical protein